jgi:DNA-binding transcriptional ArsR family regulator
LSDQLGSVFGALADPTRRGMVESLLRDGSTSVPALSADLPISRQAVAKHLAALEDAGLLERLPGRGREVRYGLRGEALAPATAWLRDAEASWDRRLGRLKGAVESAPTGARRRRTGADDRPTRPRSSG